jgi:hypothetical protein
LVGDRHKKSLISLFIWTVGMNDFSLLLLKVRIIHTNESSKLESFRIDAFITSENILIELFLNTFISFLLFSVLPDRYWSQAEDQQPKKNHHTSKALVVYRSL